MTYKLFKTSYAGHGKSLTNQLLDEGFSKFVAVGGDGTINEVASALISKEAFLGIIPNGSGNGLARSLHIPTKIELAFDVLLQGDYRTLDVGEINGLPFFCTTGLGFDAKCAHDFSIGTHSRGLKNYVKVFFKNYFSYPRQILTYKQQEYSFFAITFANAPQYGNNAFIAPLAKFDDGKLDMVLVKSHSKWIGILLTLSLFFKKIHKLAMVKYKQGSQFEIDFKEPMHLHLDGEAYPHLQNEARVKVLEAALNVFVNPN